MPSEQNAQDRKRQLAAGLALADDLRLGAGHARYRAAINRLRIFYGRKPYPAGQDFDGAQVTADHRTLALAVPAAQHLDRDPAVPLQVDPGETGIEEVVNQLPDDRLGMPAKHPRAARAGDDFNFATLGVLVGLLRAGFGGG